jgi:hypothetical protein
LYRASSSSASHSENAKRPQFQNTSNRLPASQGTTGRLDRTGRQQANGKGQDYTTMRAFVRVRGLGCPV